MKSNSSYYQENHFEEIKKGMGCLLVCKNPKAFSRYEEYFDDTRWEELILQFHQEMYNIYSMTS